MFKGQLFYLGHRCLQVGGFTGTILKRSNLDDGSFGSYTKPLIIAKMIAIPIIFREFTFRNDINYGHAQLPLTLKLNVQYY